MMHHVDTGGVEVASNKLDIFQLVTLKPMPHLGGVHASVFVL